MHWLHPSRLRERHDEVSTHKRRRFSRRFTVVGAGLLTALVFTAVAAAAQWNYYSGVCYSDGSWFTSTNDRHVTTPNDTIKTYLNSSPGGGLTIRLLNANNGQQFGSTLQFGSTQTGVTKIFATGVLNGTVFHNQFRETNAHNSPYSWDGQEWY
ncbi:MAG: hypothetical protein E6G22_16005 [Actinobacteria bacterium]|nr:MAG: hypothetical protein E6G22_16005 [Actinomycetota bacterium]